ncbi:HupE/UreJ family protein [Pseudoduganella sp. LjRoot289]|uniref:HupE/UreJ family protein n=1 Tax=Pseudoduganella sp. LjRoot289 TaxID=3342314 RepID=UPI003ECE89B2
MTTFPRNAPALALGLLAAGLALPALAHPDAGQLHVHASAAAAAAASVAASTPAGGPLLAAFGQSGWAAAFQAGFLHPLTGVDHLLAMLSVGIWGARQPQGKPLPLLFLAAMLLGTLSGVAGLSIPGLEAGIAATVVLTGVLIALAARLPLAIGAAMIAAFAVLHGNAHGHELPLAGSAFGFLAASGLLMAAGRWFGRAAGADMVRITGAGIAATGVLMMAA